MASLHFSVSSVSVPCTDTPTESFQVSLKIARKLIFSETTAAERIQFAGWKLSGSHVAEAQCRALADVTGKRTQTARNWINGDAKCGPELLVYLEVLDVYASERDLLVDFAAWLGRDILEGIK